MTRRFSLTILLLWMGMGLFPLFATLDANEIRLPFILQTPNWEFLLGADDLGRSVLSRLVIGAQTSLLVAVGVTLCSSIVGITVGSIAGYRGGWLDVIVVRIIDIFLAFPGILLAIALSAAMGPGIDNVVIALSTVGWVGYARLARAQILSVKQREHVRAAKAMGLGDTRILMRHVLPLISAPLIVEGTFGIASIVIAEAGLSYLGLGVQPPDASWGSMIRDGSQYLLVAPHLVLVPGAALMAVVLAVNLIGDQLRDFLDVKNDQHK